MSFSLKFFSLLRKLSSLLDFIEFTLSNEFQSTVPLNNWMLPAANVKLPKSFDHYKHSSKYVSVSNNDIDKNMEKWLKEWATIMKE